ncbi:FRIGIDA-like protein 5 [Trifolium pratense]|uniref:FRIGIDA-like protein 5 n=1 Tax=Trifolium pratense TaxID=57577 RepID=UPI001E69104E|nr:FRIGIDA-like protein 5 [Trifolium pratense]
MDVKDSDKPNFCVTTTLPVKRLFDNNNSLRGSMKKSKVSPTLNDDDDDYDDDDDVPIFARIKMPVMWTDKSFSILKEELALVENSFEECRRMSEIEEKRLKSIKRDIEECSKELENKKKEISCVERINEARKKMQGKVEECFKDFVAKEGQVRLMEDLIGERKQELNTKEMELRQVLDNISKHKHFERQVTQLVNGLVSKQNHFESQLKELKAKEEQYQGKFKEHQSKESKFEGRVKELESEKKHFESRLKELESKEKQFKEQMKELLSNNEEFKGQVKEFELKEEELISQKKQFENQVEDFKLKEKQFEGRWKELESKENKFKVKVNELKLKEKQFEGQEEEFVTSYMDNELSPTIDDGTSFQLLPRDKTEILANLRESSDPAKVVLDVIQNPFIPRCKMGDNAVIIDDRHIYLLEQLMRISPNIKPCVREDALKLALDLKANMKENTENSLVVLGFLLLLSIYGLVSYFDEDEVLELFAFVAQHKIAVQLFGSLGFAKKVSDFMENLVKRKQFDSTVHVTWLRRINKF